MVNNKETEKKTRHNYNNNNNNKSKSNYVARLSRPPQHADDIATSEYVNLQYSISVVVDHVCDSCEMLPVF